MIIRAEISAEIANCFAVCSTLTNYYYFFFTLLIHCCSHFIYMKNGFVIINISAEEIYLA